LLSISQLHCQHFCIGHSKQNKTNKITNVSFNSEVQYKIRGNHQASKFYAVLQRTAESSSSNPTTVKASSAKQHINGMEAAANTAAHNDDDEKVTTEIDARSMD
jgi:hypothetical protein